MIIPSKRLHAAVHFALIAAMLTALCAACSPQPEPQPLTPTPTVPEPTFTSIPTLPPFDETALTFEEGKHNRDEYCGRVFDYTQTTYGPLSIVIAGNLVEAQDPRELAIKVIDLYLDLYNVSPIPMHQPLTVFILPNPNVGECYSTENLLFVSPDELETRTFTESLLGAAAGISEYWVKYGLSSLVLGEVSDNEKLKTWYQNTDDLDMTGLFYARFLDSWASDEEQQIARLSAASLVQYALEVEGIPVEGLVQQVNNQVRTRWLASLGVDRTVNYPYDGNFAGFLYSRSSECEMLIKTGSMYFCLSRIPGEQYFDEISEAEFFIYNAYYGRKALVEYILSEAPSISHLMNPEETITFKVRDLSGRLGYTQGNTIAINKSGIYYDALHEVVHTFEWNSALLLDDNKIWLGEGFADYLGMLLPIYPQTARGRVFEDLNRLNTAETSEVDGIGTSYWYFLDPEQLETAKAWYVAQGGRMETEKSTDPRLYTDAVSFATIYRDAHGGSAGISIGAKYDYLVAGFQLKGQDGTELSYTQAASMIAWLCDTYTLDRVLNVYVNGAEDGLLDGKTYAELKAGWHADLQSRGQGIPIPGAP